MIQVTKIINPLHGTVWRITPSPPSPYSPNAASAGV